MDIERYKDNLNEDDIPELMKRGVFSNESFFNLYTSFWSYISKDEYDEYVEERDLEESKIIVLLFQKKYLLPSSIWSRVYEYLRPKKYMIDYARIIRSFHRERNFNYGYGEDDIILTVIRNNVRDNRKMTRGDLTRLEEVSQQLGSMSGFDNSQYPFQQRNRFPIVEHHMIQTVVDSLMEGESVMIYKPWESHSMSGSIIIPPVEEKPQTADQLLKQLNRESTENQKKQKGQRLENRRRRGR